MRTPDDLVHEGDHQVLGQRMITSDDGVVRRHILELELRERSPGTIYQRRRHLIRLRAFLGLDDLLTATDADLDRWQTEALRKMSPQGRAASIAHISEFYKWAVREDLVMRDPTRRLIRPKVPRGIPRPISEADLQLALETAPDRIRPWLVLAAYAGLRAAEIAGLRRDDVLDADDEPRLIVRGKGNKTRVVPIGPHLLLELQAYGMPSRGYIFRRLDGGQGPNAPWTVSHLASAHLRGLNIDSSLHKLRHRFGTKTHALTQDIRVTQELLGHASPATTAGYAAHSRRNAAKAVATLDRHLTPRGPHQQPPLPFSA